MKRRNRRSEASVQKNREQTLRRKRKVSASVRDIGSIPPPRNPQRRSACALDLKKYCETYHAETFTLAWSADHIRVIEAIERAVLTGGQQALGVFRGFGKTTLCEIACEWAALNGHRQFLLAVGAEFGLAKQIIDSIKSSLESNDLLAEDFPEVCLPIVALEGIHQRAAGQTVDGERTHISWTAKTLRLPTVSVSHWRRSRSLKGFVGAKGQSLASGVILRAAGLTGQIRGTKHRRADGVSVRPDIVLIDDPQTDQSAASPDQCDKRERLIGGPVLGCAGPGKSIAALATVTVIHKDDLADRLLDPKRHPEWHGIRCRMMLAFPTNTTLWDHYAELRRDAMRANAEPLAANKFYQDHRADMDAGASVAWPENRLPDEASGIQHAMNLYIDRGARIFSAEYQNEPMSDQPVSESTITAEGVMAKLNGLARGILPATATALTLYVDVQKTLLWWMVCAWESHFTGAVVDYGAEPEQGIDYFTLATAKRTLQQQASGAGFEGTIHAGLTRLIDRLCGREWKREDGAAIRIGKAIVDSRWGFSTTVVHQFCRTNAHAAILTPGVGYGINASKAPMREWQKKQGERHGDAWVERLATTGRRVTRQVTYDTNHWKTFTAQRLLAAIGDPGCLTLWGRNGDAHRMLVDHLTAEVPIRTSGRGRTLDEWKLPDKGRDNHWWDCLVGNAVAGSMLGVAVKGGEAIGTTKRRSIREMYDAAKGRKAG